LVLATHDPEVARRLYGQLRIGDGLPRQLCPSIRLDSGDDAHRAEVDRIELRVTRTLPQLQQNPLTPLMAPDFLTVYVM